MRASLSTLLALCALGGAGCAQAISYDQCKVDTDCAGSDGGVGYCTSDHLCVGDLPIERLCPDVVMPSGAGPHLVVASIVDRHDNLDQNIEKAIRLAVDEINLLQAGASQPPIELHVCDQQASVDGSASLRVIDHAFQTWKVSAVIGPTATADVVAVTPYARDHQIVVVTPSATSTVLDSIDSGHYVWRTAPSDAFEAKRLTQLVVSDMKALPVLDVLYADTLDNKGLEQAFFQQFAAANMVHATYSFAEGGMGIDAAVASIAADKATGLVAVSDSDDPAIATSIAMQPNLAATHIYMTDAAKSPSLLGAPAQVLANIKGTGPAAPKGATFALFQQAFKDRYGIDPRESNFASNAYDATYLVALAAAATSGHVPTGAEILQGLGKVQTSGALHTVGSSDYLNAVQAMQAGGVHLVGTSGPLEFDGKGSLTSGTYEVWGVDTTGSTPKFVTLQ